MKQIMMVALLAAFSLQLAAQNSEAYFSRIDKSAAYIEKNQLDSAAFYLQQAMRLEPANANNAMLLLNLGILQRQLRQPDDAYISFTAAIANNPEPTLVLHNRASLLCDLDRFDEAMDDYNTIIKTDPQDAEAYYRRGLLYLESNRRAEAEADFNTCNALEPNALFAKLSKALLYKLDDNWTEAEKIYSDIIRTEQKILPSYYLNRAESYINSDRTAMAAADLRAIEQSEKENPYFYVLRGRMRLEQYDKFAARKDFEKARELGYDAELTKKWIDKTK